MTLRRRSRGRDRRTFYSRFTVARFSLVPNSPTSTEMPIYERNEKKTPKNRIRFLRFIAI